MKTTQQLIESPRLCRMLRVVQALLQDSRKPLTALSRELGIPVSTLHYEVREVRKHYTFTLTPKDNVAVAELMLLQEQAAISLPRDRNTRWS